MSTALASLRFSALVGLSLFSSSGEIAPSANGEASFCTFTANTPLACPGVLASSFSAKQLKDAGRLVMKNGDPESPRRLKGTSTKGKAQTLVHKKAFTDIPWGYLAQMTPEYELLIGKIRFKKSTAKDYYYDIGGLDEDDDDAAYSSAFILVKGAAPTPDGVRWKLGTWRMVAVKKSDQTVTPDLAKGTLYLCANESEHQSASAATAGFAPCKVTFMARFMNVSVPRVMTCMYIENDRAKRSAANRNTAVTIDDQIRADSSTNGFDDCSGVVYKRFLKAVKEFGAYSPDESPYWFTCGTGCCTVETEI